jgi:penicillin-binding protein 2
MRVVTDRNGTVQRTEILKQPVAGKDVYLTIDIRMQMAAEDGLRENVEYLQANDTEGSPLFPTDSGAAVAMDPNTFEILAIASYPTYDLETYSLNYNDLVANSARPLVNRALRETYAPGSPFKVGVGLAGLCEGEITEHSTIKCTGIYYGLNFSGYHPACSTYDQHASAPYLNIKRALADSCNCFFYRLGRSWALVR